MGILNEGSGSGFYMPVAPAYGNGGGLFGGDGNIWGLLLVLLLCGNGMWGGFGGMGLGGMMMPWMMGMGGGFGMDYLYPWLNNSQHMSDGFRDQALQGSIAGLQNSITSGFGDVQLGLAGINQNICQTGNTITGAVRDGFYGAEIAANGRAMTNMQQLFGVQSAITDSSAKQQASAADVKYTIAAEECATRSASANNTRDIIDSQNRGIQTIMDKLCQLELDGVKGELAAANSTISQLRTQLLVANNEASQVAQTGQIVDGVYNRLSSCPVSTTPVYGRQPIFTCQQGGCGCGAYAA